MDGGKLRGRHSEPAKGGEGRFPEPAKACGTGMKGERDELFEAFAVFRVHISNIFLMFHHHLEIVGGGVAVAKEEEGGGGLFDLFLPHAGFGEGGFEFGIIDNEKMGRLEVVAGGCPAGGVEKAVKEPFGEGIRPEGSDGTAGAGEMVKFIEIHAVIPKISPNAHPL